MSAYINNDIWANQMMENSESEEQLAFSGQLEPLVGFEGAEAQLFAGIQQPEGPWTQGQGSTQGISMDMPVGIGLGYDHSLGMNMDMMLNSNRGPTATYLPAYGADVPGLGRDYGTHELQDMGLYGMNSPGYVDPIESLMPDHGMFTYQGPFTHDSVPAPFPGSFALPVTNMNTSMFALPNPTFPVQVQAQVPVQVIQVQGRRACHQASCTKTFKRDSDRRRHEVVVHGVNRPLQLHLCHVPGCIRSVGAGYSRHDKLVEHLWKKHANLGFARRA
ncbi:hypothetical protein VTL71DRAFT_11230 [Oculimacula yallundae]|uniref:C2H2-type domain-containing protein n=1 Tax=Oculimacula yallundae TaxID=86028 RepID=A0ABR4CVH3_9HELO